MSELSNHTIRFKVFSGQQAGELVIMITSRTTIVVLVTHLFARLVMKTTDGVLSLNSCTVASSSGSSLRGDATNASATAGCTASRLRGNVVEMVGEERRRERQVDAIMAGLRTRAADFRP